MCRCVYNINNMRSNIKKEKKDNNDPSIMLLV